MNLGTTTENCSKTEHFTGKSLDQITYTLPWGEQTRVRRSDLFVRLPWVVEIPCPFAGWRPVAWYPSRWQGVAHLHRFARLGYGIEDASLGKAELLGHYLNFLSEDFQ